jgi:hypothetical protein
LTIPKKVKVRRVKFVSKTTPFGKNDHLKQRLIVPMSRAFYRLVFCAFVIRKNEGTLNVMGGDQGLYILTESEQSRRDVCAQTPLRF